MTDLDRSKPPTLDYQPPRKTEYRRGATPTTRAVAGVLSVFLAAVALVAWREDGRETFAADSAFTPGVLFCVAGSAFCLLVALGRIGRHKDGWI